MLLRNRRARIKKHSWLMEFRRPRSAATVAAAVLAVLDAVAVAVLVVLVVVAAVFAAVSADVLAAAAVVDPLVVSPAASSLLLLWVLLLLLAAFASVTNVLPLRYMNAGPLKRRLRVECPSVVWKRETRKVRVIGL